LWHDYKEDAGGNDGDVEHEEEETYLCFITHAGEWPEAFVGAFAVSGLGAIVNK
jgi:hypothetical protein